MEAMTMAYHDTHNVETRIIRIFNTYGPRQSARAVIPTIITQLLLGQTTLKLGDLTPTRDFNYVKDTAQGFIALAEADSAVGKEINIATGKEFSVGDVARILVSELNPDAQIITDAQRLRPEASEVFRLIGDNTLITTLTPWQPRFELDAGLRDTIAWFRESENLSRYKAWLYNV
jgi:nucleoside-diphosphate-sugar epimerase